MVTTRWRRLAQNRMLDFGAAGIAIVVMVLLLARLPNQWRESDFAHYYLSGRLLQEGENPYTTPAQPMYQRYGFIFSSDIKSTATGVNPPTLLWLFAPLALLPPAPAFVAWTGVQAASLGMILWLTRRLLRGRLSLRGWRFVCAGAVASAAVFWHLYYAQMQLLLAAMVLAAYACQREGRHTTACLTVAAAGMVKLFPFIILPWFVWRSGSDFPTRARAAAWAVIFSGMLFLVSGPHLWKDFFEHGVPVLKAYAMGPAFFNFTIPSFLAFSGYAAHLPHPALEEIRAWWMAGMAIGLTLIALTYFVCLRSTADTETQFCLLSAMMLAGSGKAEGHYFVFLIFPIAVAAVRVAERPTVQRVTWFAFMLVLLNNMGTWQTPYLDRHLFLEIGCNYTPLIALLALAIFFAKQLRHNQWAAFAANAMKDAAGTTSSTPPRP